MEQLGSHLAVYSHGGSQQPCGGAVADKSRGNAAPEGLSALVNASTIHQSLREAEHADTLSRMAAARRHTLHRPFSHALRMERSAEDATPNKRQRRD